MSKSKVMTLPAGTTVTLWREDSQMCVGLKAPRLGKGLRLATKASGDVGKELSAYLQTLRLAPIVEELEEAGVTSFDNDADGGVIAWGDRSGTLDFLLIGDGSVDVGCTGTPFANPYLLATLLRRVIDTYDQTITSVIHNDDQIGALLALSYQPKVTLNVEDQQVEKGDLAFKLVQANDDLGFLIGDGGSLRTIEFASECARMLDREESTIVITDESLDSVENKEHIEIYVRGYMARSNAVWISPTKDGFTVYAPGNVTYFLDSQMTLQGVHLEGKAVADDGADHQMLRHVDAVLNGSRQRASESVPDDESKLTAWTKKLESQGIADAATAARVLLAQGLI